jgi:alpha-ketoglutaric semialdehyde dehydrogenase
MRVDAQNLIGGLFQAGQASTDNLCPADTRQVVGTAPVSGTEEIDAAVAAARQAFATWGATTAPARGELLFRLVRLLERDSDKIARVMAWEEGKILAEAQGEMGKAIRYVEFAAGDCRRMTGITAQSEIAGTLCMTMWRPLGVVGLITPWNFPAAIPLWKLAPALAAGNCVVLKPAPETPATAHLIAELCMEAGFPAGVFNVVHGDATPARALVDHRDVAAISFTGSTNVGLAIEARCGQLHKRAQCEMGGKNPVIVLDDADVALAASAAAKGAFSSTGQRCTATSRAIVMEHVADAFVEAVTAAALAIRPGHPLDPETTMGPAVSERQLHQILRHMDGADSQGRRTCGGGRLDQGDLRHGFFPAPTVYDRVAPDAPLATEEIFGPVLTVVRVATVDAAVAAANSVRFGLTGSVYTRDLSRAFHVVEHLEAGITHVNNPTIGGEAHLPFGGVKDTGTGPREMGPDAWRFFAEEKAVYINHGGGLRKGNLY